MEGMVLVLCLRNVTHMVLFPIQRVGHGTGHNAWCILGETQKNRKKLNLFYLKLSPLNSEVCYIYKRIYVNKSCPKFFTDRLLI